MTSKFYGVCSAFLFNEDNHSEGKLMALAALGQSNSETYKSLEGVLHDIGTSPREKGLEILNSNFAEVKNGAITHTQKSLDFAATAQKLFSDRRISDTEYVLRNVNLDSKNLVFAGGSCLNLDANREIYDTFSSKNQFIAPCCDDTGQALGAVCVAIVEHLGIRPQIALPYLGMGQEHYAYDSAVLDMVVDTLVRDGIAILHNGKAEIGPRALGNRSFIARADSIEVKKKLSEQVKQRESYRPVAPLVLKEKLGEYFIGPSISPYMLYKHDVRAEVIHTIIGCAHVDNSARVQTVEKNNNPFLYDLIKRFGDKTGTYVLLNTSLNLKGDPISNDIMQSLKIYDQIDGEKIIVYNGKVL
jgi:carbamoyltransferase